MPSGIRKTVTPEQIAKYGHIAAIFRDYMAKHGIEQPVFLGKQIGLNREQMGMLYKWIGAKAAPGPRYRNKLAKIMGVKPAELELRHVHDMSVPVPVPVAHGQLIPRKPAADALTFNVDADGEARLRIDVKLPLDKGTALLRLILDANVLLADQQEDTA